MLVESHIFYSRRFRGRHIIIEPQRHGGTEKREKEQIWGHDLKFAGIKYRVPLFAAENTYRVPLFHTYRVPLFRKIRIVSPYFPYFGTSYFFEPQRHGGTEKREVEQIWGHDLNSAGIKYRVPIFAAEIPGTQYA